MDDNITTNIAIANITNIATTINPSAVCDDNLLDIFGYLDISSQAKFSTACRHFRVLFINHFHHYDSKFIHLIMLCTYGVKVMGALERIVERNRIDHSIFDHSARVLNTMILRQATRTLIATQYRTIEGTTNGLRAFELLMSIPRVRSMDPREMLQDLLSRDVGFLRTLLMYNYDSPISISDATVVKMAADNYLDHVKLLLNDHRDLLAGHVGKLFTTACQHGCFNMVNYLMMHDSVQPAISMYYVAGIRQAINGKHIALALHVLKNSTVQIFNNDGYSGFFEDLCKYRCQTREDILILNEAAQYCLDWARQRDIIVAVLTTLYIDTITMRNFDVVKMLFNESTYWRQKYADTPVTDKIWKMIMHRTRTPQDVLGTAVYYHYINTVNWLLDNTNADLTLIPDIFMDTLRRDEVLLMARLAADPRMNSKFSQMGPLMSLVCCRNYAMLQVFLASAGCDPNAENKRALVKAVKMRDQKAVSIIMESGKILLNLWDRNINKALDMAYGHRDKEMIMLLRKYWPESE